MKSRTRIGARNKTFDLISLILEILFALVLVVMIFLYESMIYFSVVVVIAVGFQCLKTLQYNYIFFEGAHFVAEGVLKQKARIPVHLYESLSRPPIGSSMPFSNELIISFSNGLRFKFDGGVSRKEDIEALVDRLIAESKQ